MSFKLSVAATATYENNVRVVGVFKERAKIFTYSTLGYFETIECRLSADIHRVDDNTDLRVKREFVVR